jgi:hypothetical protein
MSPIRIPVKKQTRSLIERDADESSSLRIFTGNSVSEVYFKFSGHESSGQHQDIKNRDRE